MKITGIVEALRSVFRRNTNINNQDTIERYLHGIITKNSEITGRLREDALDEYGKQKVLNSLKEEILDYDPKDYMLKEREKKNLCFYFWEFDKIGGEEAIKVLSELVKADKEEVRKNAAKRIYGFESINADQVENLLDNEELKSWAARGSTPDLDEVDDLKKEWAESSSDRLKLHSNISLLRRVGYSKKPSVYERLKKLLRSEDIPLDEKAEAIKIIQKEVRHNSDLKVDSLDDILYELIIKDRKQVNSNKEVRKLRDLTQEAVEALGNLGTEKSVKYLEDLKVLNADQGYLKAKGKEVSRMSFRVSNLEHYTLVGGRNGITGEISLKIGDEYVWRDSTDLEDDQCHDGSNTTELADSAKAIFELVSEVVLEGHSSGYATCCTCGDRGCDGQRWELRDHEDRIVLRENGRVFSIPREEFFESITDFYDQLIENMEGDISDSEPSYEDLKEMRERIFQKNFQNSG